MKVPPLSLWILFALWGLCPSANPQQVPPGAPVPHGLYDSPAGVSVPPVRAPNPPLPRMDAIALQREAKQLLDLSQSLQPDVEALQRGLLRKDIVEKLKKIEKLSKHLRGEIAPLSN